MSTRLCKICSGEKPLDDSVPARGFAKARGFMGNICWECFCEKRKAVRREEPEKEKRRLASLGQKDKVLELKALARERHALEEAAAAELLKMEKQRAWVVVESQIEKDYGLGPEGRQKNLEAWHTFCQEWGM